MTTAIKSSRTVIVASVAAAAIFGGGALSQVTTNVEEKSPAQLSIEGNIRNDALDTTVNTCTSGTTATYLADLQQRGFDFGGPVPSPSEVCLEALRAIADRSTVATDTTPLADREIMGHYNYILSANTALYPYRDGISPELLHLSTYGMAWRNDATIEIPTATGTPVYALPENWRAGEAVVAGYFERVLHPNNEMPQDILTLNERNGELVGQILAGCLIGLPPSSQGGVPLYHLCLMSGYIQADRDNQTRIPFYQTVPPLPGTP